MPKIRNPARSSLSGPPRIVLNSELSPKRTMRTTIALVATFVTTVAIAEPVPAQNSKLLKKE
jgi:hypothetical protein